ncbi:hypothetical protein P167DRAFT_464349, partial [Morchella conica CCBAS932]
MKSLNFFLPLLLPAAALCQQLSVTKFANTLLLPASFDPIIAAYWTGLPHHRRTPFSVSPDGKSAYLAYLDTTYNAVYVQQVDTTTFAAVGDAVQVEGAREAGGLVAQNDGFALLANFIPDAGTTDAPPNGYPIAEIVRYKDGAQAWRTPVNGPGVHEADGLSASPDMNGDLVYSEAAGLYAAYVVVTAYTGAASGHFGDSIQYVDDSGALKTIAGASSTWGCSHNTGIGLEAADAAPFASVCAEDQGAIWLNTDTQTMNGIKIANENTTNGVSGEPMGGMGGSYSNLALFPDTTSYIFAWQSRGALNLQENSWLGTGFTTCSPRWLNHNVAVSLTTSKDKLLGEQASSVVGTAEGDTQVTWITESDTTDHQNVHVATLDSGNAVVTWEELADPDCQPVPLSCTGTFNGTWAQVVGSKGEKVGEKVLLGEDVYVSGDMVTMGEKVCWPYVDMVWDLSAPKANGTYVKEMSFACVSLSGSGDAVSSSTSAAVAATSSVPATSSLIS